MILQKLKLPLTERVDRMSAFIGNTPLFPIRNMFRKPGVELYVKLEWQQLSGSIKARAAYRIVRDAILADELEAGQELLDATSGNTGIAYATLCRSLGIKVTLCVPENISPLRKNILETLGAHLVYSSKFDSTDGAQERVQEMLIAFPNKFYNANQYGNNSNWKAHYFGTAQEILEQTDKEITHFVAGLGTTGTFMGTTRGLKAYDENIVSVALQPGEVLHGLEGWKHMDTARVPEIFDHSLADHNLTVETWEAYNVMRQAAEKEGLLISPSAAANLAGAIKVAEQLDYGTVVTVLPDNADKYPEILDEIF